jgi:hypothetical protein
MHGFPDEGHHGFMEARMVAVVVMECGAQELYDRGMGMERMDQRCKVRVGLDLSFEF